MDEARDSLNFPSFSITAMLNVMSFARSIAMNIKFNKLRTLAPRTIMILITGLGLSTAASSSTTDVLNSHDWKLVTQDQYFSYSIDPQSVHESTLNHDDASERILEAPIKIVTLKDIPKYDYHQNEMAVQFNHYNCSTQQFSIGQIRSYTADGTLFDDDPSDRVEWIPTETGSPNRVILDQICKIQ